MKKQLLIAAAITFFGFFSGYSQQFKVGKANNFVSAPTQNKLERCSTPEPDEQWSAEFEKLVQQYKLQNTDATGKVAAANYTIPVIVHIIHSGEAVGSGTNISAAQVADQIRILNEDYAGIGLSSNNVPYAFNGLKADCNIRFCLATKDEAGNTLAEPGIDRVAASSIPVTIPGTGLSKTTIDGTIKPATIWDPVKYCNMWVLKLDQTLLGYATFPLSSTLTGIPPGSTGSSTTDGLVMGYDYFGSIGAASGSAPYNKGRTTTHEIGHWLGLRHIWGDNGQCGATDYAVDTPPQKGGTSAPAGSNYGAPTGGYNGYPFQPSTCTRNDGTAGASVTNTHGDMFMNFMDYTNDIAMYMFTNDQRTRIQTAMANGTFRKFLGTHSLCSSSGVAAAAPVAGFDWERTIAVTSAAVCNGVAVNFKDASRNYPTSWAWSTNPSTGVTINSSSSQNPQITFANSGTYTVTLVATNAVNSNTKTRVITVNACSATPPTANFTLASSGCVNVSMTPTNSTSGNPTPTYAWATNPSTGVTISNSTAAAPTITFANAGTYTVSLTATNSGGSSTFTTTTTIGACATCDTLKTNITNLNSIAYYGLDAVSPQDSGYLSGTGAYTSAVAEKYTYANDGKKLAGIRVYVVFTDGTGNVTFNVYNDNAGKPGTTLASKTVSLSSIASTGYYNIMLTTPVTPAATYYVGYTVPTTAAAGDTIVTFTTNDGTGGGTAGSGFFKYGTTWLTYSTNVGLDISNYLFPIMCPTVGIDENVIDMQVGLYPNPTSGIFNLDLTMENQSDVKIEITNMLGQSVYNSFEKNIKTISKSIDLSNYSKGIYVVNLSNDKGKVVRKIVIE